MSPKVGKTMRRRPGPCPEYTKAPEETKATTTTTAVWQVSLEGCDRPEITVRAAVAELLDKLHAMRMHSGHALDAIIDPCEGQGNPPKDNVSRSLLNLLEECHNVADSTLATLKDVVVALGNRE